MKKLNVITAPHMSALVKKFNDRNEECTPPILPEDVCQIIQGRDQCFLFYFK